MWTRRIGFVLLLLLAGVVFLVLPQRGTEMQVLAEAPALKPSTSSTTYLPFIVYHDSLSRSPLWRFGIDRVRRPLSTYIGPDFAHLRLSWYIDFTVTDNPETPNGMEYMPMVRMKQLKTGPNPMCCVGCSYQVPAAYSISPPTSTIASMAAARPGQTWIVGNEMERIDWLADPAHPATSACLSQDEMLPDVYAQAYHDVYTALHGADPTAQIAIGALVQPSTLRIKWLDQVWTAYSTRYGVPMPVDIWTIHVYVYNEQKGQFGADIPAGLPDTAGSVFQIRDNKDFNKASPMIVAWRTWMKNHGQQNKPLITPEYGAVYPEWLQDPPGTVTFSPSQIRDSYLYPSFNYFLNHTDASIGMPADGNRLVQRWAWWSMDYDDGVCDPGDPFYYMNHSGALFFSGLGPSAGLTTCNYPSQGLSSLGTYFTNYVQPLPVATSKPYAPVRSPVVAAPSSSAALTVNDTADLAVAKNVPESAFCSESPEVRAQFLQSLPSRSTPEGEQAWVRALSGLTPGTRICMP